MIVAHRQSVRPVRFQCRKLPIRPAAVIGIPVGFVGAAESKAALAASPLRLEFLTVHGRRGGSAITSAAVNALASRAE